MSGIDTTNGAPKQGRPSLLPRRSHAEKRLSLREHLSSGRLLVVPGAYDAASTALVQTTGYKAVHATGAGISCVLGVPDIGLLSMTEVLRHVRLMVEATDLPLVADIDTGYGNQLNVVRAVRAFEDAGVAALHIEDQVFPKKCGLLAGREVIPVPDMLRKLEAALDARMDDALVVIARTDARDTLGLESVIERGRAFNAAGADMVFVYGAKSMDELRAIRDRVPGPLMTHVSKGSAFSGVTAIDLETLGYQLVIHALSPLEVALFAVREFLVELRSGTSEGPAETGRMLSYDELYGLVRLPDWLEIEKRYAS